MSARGRFEARGRGRPGRISRRGFTLLEVLLTLAILALLAGILVVGAVQLTEPKSITPEDVFWNAVREARKEALLTGQPVKLRPVVKNKSSVLVATGASGEKRFTFDGDPQLVVDFLSTQKGSAILIHSQLVETQTIPSATFYGDGTCTPFRVQFRSGGAARAISIDPWTCAPVLPAASNARSS